jgi:hypothetical protein
VTTARAARAALFAAALAAGCGGPFYDLRPAPRAETPGNAVAVRVPRVEWRGQLGSYCAATVELEVSNGDAARAASIGAPRLVAGSALGGPSLDFELKSPDLDQDRTVAPGATRVFRAAFVSSAADGPQGPLRLTVVVPVEGQGAVEVPIADPRPGGPRWLAPRASGGAYLRGSWSLLGDRSTAFHVLEPVGLSARRSFGRWVVAFDERYTFLYQTGANIPSLGRAMGLSFLVDVAWEPWRFPLAPYVEGGGFGGFATSGDGGSRWSGAGRASGGVLIMGGPRLGAGGALPFEGPASPQRQAGLRLGYTRWFYSGAGAGTSGFELSVEIGFGR